MNPHPFSTKRARPHLGGEEPVPSSSSLAPRLDLSHSSLPPEIQHTLDKAAAFYGFASGYQVHIALQQGNYPKRRRIDSSSRSMPKHLESSMTQGSLEKLANDQLSHGQSSQEQGWSEPGLPSSSLASPSSPLYKRMTDSMSQLLSCPCCGFGLKQPHGYQQLSAVPPVVYGPERAYDVEKPPTMQLPSSEPYGSLGLQLGQSTAFPVNDQPILTPPPLAGFPLLSDHSSLEAPLTYDYNPDYQHDLSTSQYYSSLPFKQEPQLQDPTAVSNFTLQQDSSSLAYGTNLGFNTTALAASQENTQYNIAAHWNESTLLDNPDNFGMLLPNQRGGKRGPFKDPTLREQTAQTRKIGSCIRCRMQRIRCETNNAETNGACLTCKKVANSRAGRFPCLRYKITEIRLYKPGQVPGYEWTRRWNNNISDPIQSWASSEIKVIQISDGLSDRTVEFKVRKFIPQEGDKLERTWDYNGTKKSVSIPPYALVSLDAGKIAYSSHIRDAMRDTFKSLLGPADEILYRTYLAAVQLCSDPSAPDEHRDVMAKTLKLWMSIRLSTRSGFIVGDETLGMDQNILDETSPNHGMIPVPPVLGAQLDVILIHHIQTKLRRELLDQFQKMLSKNKQNAWLVTYLVTFILLHNNALITAHDASYARKHGMKRRFAREDKVREYHLGANILLAHFHYCNKGVYPFSDDCKDQELRNLANLNEEKIDFVRQTRAYAQKQKRAWKDLRDQGTMEDDFFFVSQLFEQNWQPRGAA